MHDSPRTRRLKNDLISLQQLRAESSIFDFEIDQVSLTGLPEGYRLLFRGRGLWRPPGSSQVMFRDTHEVSLQLNASYPRLMPALGWKTPIFHPNVASTGVVCLGGYGKYWVPSLSLDELCSMLWDMIRYENFDVNSPYNREAAYWASAQARDVFPVDSRSIRDRQAARSCEPVVGPSGWDRRPIDSRAPVLPAHRVAPPPVVQRRLAPVEPEIVFLE